MLLRAAADLEGATDKHPVTPGSVLPAREQLADLLLERGKPAEALREYELPVRAFPGSGAGPTPGLTLPALRLPTLPTPRP